MIAVLIAAALAASDALSPSVAELRGRPFSDVVTLLGGSSNPTPSIRLIGTRGAVEIYPLQQLTPPSSEDQVCEVRLERPDAPSVTSTSFQSPTAPGGYHRIAAVYVVVRNGVVAEILNPPIRPPVVRREGEGSDRFLRRWMSEDRDPWLSVSPGRLPLSDADGFLERRPDLAAPGEAVIRRRCRPRTTGASYPNGFDHSGLLQGLSLLPLVWRLPALNHQRRTAQVQGASLYGSLAVGALLPGGGAGFAERHRGVRRYWDAQDPTYEILSIDIGAEPSRNLARMNAAALVGVREGRIVWLADGEGAASLGLLTAICIDASRRLGASRPGCSDTGYFRP
ncbi:hypothetical protein [Brevundimonas aurantiaca]|uniref:hypothetical protein n=1 Tax=Brevundimonas aurantiaca TaxID=74316 RepID=UPI00191A4412|nr:hypothetical protein [Brevundimonas aurantiaca]